jgi:hypothetical protein
VTIRLLQVRLEELIDMVRIDVGLVNGDAYVDCENVIELTTS